MHVTRTKIVATLGPASWEEPMLAALFEAGVDVARINCSHTDADGIRRQVARVRRTAMKTGRQIAILLDLQGPKIRIEKFEEGKVLLSAGQEFTLVCRADAPDGDARQVGVSYLGLVNDVHAGDTLLLDDGLMAVEVLAIEGANIRTRVLTDGVLSNRKGLNRLGGGLSLGGATL